jgi:hypothetical protein
LAAVDEHFVLQSLGGAPRYQWTREDEALASGSRNKHPNQTKHAISEGSLWSIVLQGTRWKAKSFFLGD